MVSMTEGMQDAGTTIGFVSGGYGIVGITTLSDIIEQLPGAKA
jgi:CBS domain containing-hemolysin-like protein